MDWVFLTTACAIAGWMILSIAEGSPPAGGAA